MECQHGEVGTMGWTECLVKPLVSVDRAEVGEHGGEARRGGIGYGSVGGGDAGGVGGNRGMEWSPGELR